MRYDELQLEVHAARWNRRILNVYWAVVLISVAVESLDLMFTERSAKEFFLSYILLPTILLLAVVLLNEFALRYSKRLTDYYMILSATSIATVLIAVHSTMNVIWSTLFLSLLVSIVYFSRRKILFAFGVSLMAYLLLSTLHPYIRAHTSIMELFTMSAVLATAAVTAIGIMQRGIEIAGNLKKTIEAQQELMVKHTLMEKLTKTDALTGLNNHMSYHEYLGELIRQSEQYHLPLHLAILDIDNFKKVNDTYGHRVGDLMLKYVADTIKSVLKADDFVARYGGEEFVVVFADCKAGDVLKRVESICESVASVPQELLEGCRLTVSIGLNSFRPGSNKEDLFE
ncbi:MAG: GGDEF domain-containing protein, partial [Tumebacillaceae bacterium]